MFQLAALCKVAVIGLLISIAVVLEAIVVFIRQYALGMKLTVIALWLFTLNLLPATSAALKV